MNTVISSVKTVSLLNLIFTSGLKQIWKTDNCDLLELYSRLVVPVDTHIRFVVTGQDVIHDLAVPSAGLKSIVHLEDLTKHLYLFNGKAYTMDNVQRFVEFTMDSYQLLLNAKIEKNFLSWIDSMA